MKRDQTITVDMVLSWRPCEAYTRRRLDTLIGDGITPLEITDRRKFRGVSESDRLWVLLRPDLLDDSTLRLFACWCARQVLALVEDPDPRSLSAVDIAECFARGEADRSALAAAESAAWAAAESAARYAAAAAGYAARAAARHAAGYASAAAAAAAGYAARYAAANGAAAQIRQLRKMIGQTGDEQTMEQRVNR